MAKKKHSNKLGRILIIGLVAAGVYLTLNVTNYRSAMSAAREKQRVLLEEQALLERQLALSENKLEFMGTDEYIEQEARERLGWLRPGEIMYVDASGAAVPHELERATATPTPTPPGPVQTARPSVPVPGRSTPTPSPSKSPEGTASQAPAESEASSTTRTLPPEPSSSATPKSIG